MQNSKLKIKFKRFNGGFTLMELLIVIAIIGILASLLMVNFIGVRQRARDSQRKADLRQIQSALELYRADQGNYPTPLPACGSPLIGGNPQITYMQKIPCEPISGNPAYAYGSSGGTTYSLTACLENLADEDSNIERTTGTPPVKIHCTGTGGVDLGTLKLTLRNP